MTRGRRRARWPAAALLLALTGCAGVSPLPAELHVPLPPLVAPAPVARATGVWRVAPFSGSSLYLERAMVYSNDDGRTLQQHPHQYWLDSPAQLARDALLTTLRDARVGTLVVAAAGAAAALEVRGRVLAFDRLVTGEVSTVRLALELELVDTATREVRLSRRYEERQPAVANDAAGSAAAAAQALGAVYRRFVVDAMQALDAR